MANPAKPVMLLSPGEGYSLKDLASAVVVAEQTGTGCWLVIKNKHDGNKLTNIGDADLLLLIKEVYDEH